MRGCFFFFLFIIFFSFSGSVFSQSELGKTYAEIDNIYEDFCKVKKGSFSEDVHYLRYDIFEDWICIFYFRDNKDSSKCYKINKILPSLGFYQIVKYLENNGFKNRGEKGGSIVWNKKNKEVNIRLGSKSFYFLMKNNKRNVSPVYSSTGKNTSFKNSDIRKLYFKMK